MCKTFHYDIIIDNKKVVIYIDPLSKPEIDRILKLCRNVIRIAYVHDIAAG